MFRSVQFFLSAEMWVLVKEHCYRGMAVQALARSECKSEINSAKKQENRRFFVTEAFAESFKCRAEILNFLKPRKLFFLLGACVPDRTDS